MSLLPTMFKFDQAFDKASDKIKRYSRKSH